jgi:uncharacterized membrane protein
MDVNVMEWLNILFRWLHVVAGVMWIGQLWFFNFVNAQLAKTYDADSKKKVVPELMPRALYFFRWGAAWTWVTGFLLLGIVYYHPLVLVPMDSSLGVGGGIVLSLAILVAAFFVYDALWKSGLGKNETQAAAISVALLVAVAVVLSFFYTGRALYIHIGAILGTIMAMNVWMRIWPAQRKIIGGIKGTGPAADPPVVALAGLRSKHNTYMSVPLMLFMVSNHWSTALEAQAFGIKINWLIIGLVIVVGFGLAKYLYVKSASTAPSQF